MTVNLANFTDILNDDEIINDSQQSQPMSLPSSTDYRPQVRNNELNNRIRPPKGTGQYNEFRSVEEIDEKYKNVFVYPFFNLVQSRVIDDALYSDKSMVVCAPTGSGKTVIFEMAIVQLLMQIEENNITDDFKIFYMAPVKALCTERLTEWYSKFTRLGLLCIEVTGDTDVDFVQLKAYKIIITTPEKWDMLTRRWRDHRGLVEMIKLFLIDEVHILNDETRGPVLEAVVSRMKTIQTAAQSAHRIETLQKQYQNRTLDSENATSYTVEFGPTIRFVAVSATVSNPEDVAAWLNTDEKPAVYYKFGDECRPVKLRRVVEGYPCQDGTSIFKFDIILSYKLWPIIQKYHDGKPSLIFCNTRKSVQLTAETLSREITINFSPEQKAKLTALASTIKNKKLQSLILAGVGCHHAGLLYEERTYIEHAFRNGDLPILITTTTLAMGVNLPAHLVIIKNTMQYVNGAYQEYSISTVLQMMGRAGRPQFDSEATAVIMTRQRDKARYQALASGSEPLQSYLHKRLAENLNSETALGTVCDVAQCVQWLRSTFLYVRAAKDPKRYLGLTSSAPDYLILKKLEELCVRAINGLASAGLITMDEASCIEATEAGRLMSVYYLDLETMKLIMKIEGHETLERLLWILCECHELADMHLRTDERRTLNALNRNNTAATIRFPMKGKIATRQMKLSCIIQAILGCLPIPDPSLNQEAMKIMRIADRICKCLVAYVTRPEPVTLQRQYFSAVLNTVVLSKCVAAHLWENSPYVSKQLKGIGPTFSTLLATAGKVNFMLLEESHPRDLERIMNKGPPAGNVLRKQVSLLPKYKLEATPVDEKTVSVKLLLLNQAFLAENTDNLTAGPTHKCYVIVGDSENHILLLSHFVDKDLISVYDGTITYKISRKHSFEHKIFIHCISSTFVGIDAQCEYTFTDLMPQNPHNIMDTSSNFFETNSKKILKKSINVSDMPKQRKRKNSDDEISQSKEKKKRDNALTEKLRFLKESFGRTSTVLKKDLQKTKEMAKNVLNDLGYSNQTSSEIILKKTDNIETITIDDVDMNLLDGDDVIVDEEKIDSILNAIETEITKNNEPIYVVIDDNQKHFSKTSPRLYKSQMTVPQISVIGKRTKKPESKNNYMFLDRLEKFNDFSDNDMPVKETGFSDAIKLQIENFMQNSYKGTSPLEAPMSILYKLPETTEITNANGNASNGQLSTMLNVTTSDAHLIENDLKKNANTYEDKENKVSDSHHPISDKNNFDDQSNLNYNSFELDLPEINVMQPINKITPRTIAILKGGEKRNSNTSFDCLSFIENKSINYNGIQESPNEANTFLHNHKTIGEPFNEITQKTIPEITMNGLNNNWNKVHLKQQLNNEKCNYEINKYEDTNNFSPEPPDNNAAKPATVLVQMKIPDCTAERLNDIKGCDNAYETTRNDLSDLYKGPSNNENWDINQSAPIIENKSKTNKNITDAVGSVNDSTEVITFSNNINKMIQTIPNNNNKKSPEPLHNKTAFDIDTNKYPMYNYMNGFTLRQMENEMHIHPVKNTSVNFNVHESVIKNIRSTQSKSVENQLQSTQSMYHTNPNQQNSINNLEVCENRRSTEFENKYSFAAEKIDIQTKYTNDHKIRIIRRLKVDLDIREIVSKHDKQNINESDSNFNKRTTNQPTTEYTLAGENNNTRQCFIERQKGNVLKESSEPLSLLESNKSTSGIRITDTTNNQQRADDEKWKNYIHKESPKCDQTDSRKIPINENIHQVNDNSKHYNNQVSLKSDQTRLLEAIKNDKTNTTELTNRKSDDGQTSKQEGIGNILQKYAQIISRNKKDDIKSSPHHSTNTVHDIKYTYFKPSRRFKIADINNLNLNLPSLCDNIKPQSVTVTQAAHVRSINANRLDITHTEIQIPNSPTKDLEYECLELTPCQSPEQLFEQSLEVTVDDFKIDQSMFNPKTLLQNIGRDDMELDIIPPPPEFCNDDINYSPQFDNKDNVNSPNFNNALNETFECRYHDTSVFEDVFPDASNLTPSREIETWTLDRDDTLDSSHNYTTPTQSYTVMRRKMFQNDTPQAQDTIDTRRGRLSQFKFNCKNKIKK